MDSGFQQQKHHQVDNELVILEFVEYRPQEIGKHALSGCILGTVLLNRLLKVVEQLHQYYLREEVQIYLSDHVVAVRTQV